MCACEVYVVCLFEVRMRVSIRVCVSNFN
uniref:Uncharacterized protein n=1 Tax=Anguilla anguilla TaxID=7936 RepID=A0A0E9RBG0_ANGAN